jgi:hypothetical protein
MWTKRIVWGYANTISCAIIYEAIATLLYHKNACMQCIPEVHSFGHEPPAGGDTAPARARPPCQLIKIWESVAWDFWY